MDVLLKNCDFSVCSLAFYNSIVYYQFVISLCYRSLPTIHYGCPLCLSVVYCTYFTRHCPLCALSALSACEVEIVGVNGGIVTFDSVIVISGKAIMSQR